VNVTSYSKVCSECFDWNLDYCLHAFLMKLNFRSVFNPGPLDPFFIGRNKTHGHKKKKEANPITKYKAHEIICMPRGNGLILNIISYEWMLFCSTCDLPHRLNTTILTGTNKLMRF
jgi:hypothetical protein